MRARELVFEAAPNSSTICSSPLLNRSQRRPLFGESTKRRHKDNNSNDASIYIDADRRHLVADDVYDDVYYIYPHLFSPRRFESARLHRPNKTLFILAMLNLFFFNLNLRKTNLTPLLLILLDFFNFVFDVKK